MRGLNRFALLSLGRLMDSELTPIDAGVPPLAHTASSACETALGAAQPMQVLLAMLLNGIAVPVFGSEICWPVPPPQLPAPSNVPPLPVHNAPKSPLRKAPSGTRIPVTGWLP